MSMHHIVRIDTYLPNRTKLFTDVEHYRWAWVAKMLVRVYNLADRHIPGGGELYAIATYEVVEQCDKV